MTPDVQRWFDGTDWTEHTRPLPESALPARQPGAAAADRTLPDAGGPTTTATESWPGASGGAWLPGEPIDQPGPAPDTSAGWAGTGAPGWGGRGMSSRFGTPEASHAGAARFGGFGASERFGASGGFNASGGLGASGGAGTAVPTTSGWGTVVAGSGATGGIAGRATWPPPGYPAHWGWRVLAHLLDQLIVSTPYVVGAVAATVSATGGVDTVLQAASAPATTGSYAFLIGGLVALVLWFANRVVLQGRTGQSWGKRAVGLRTLHQDSGEPLGMWWALVRDFAYVVNAVPLCLGYLWPLWDARRQTFADKATSAVVLRDPR